MVVLQVGLLRHRDVNIKTASLRACANIVTGDDTQTQAVIEAGLVGGLTELLSSNKRGIRKEAIWCLSNITAGQSVTQSLRE